MNVLYIHMIQGLYEFALILLLKHYACSAEISVVSCFSLFDGCVYAAMLYLVNGMK
jgi:hypothetical protein